MTCVTTATTAPQTRPERRANGADMRSTRSSAEKSSLRLLGFASLEKPGGCSFDKNADERKVDGAERKDRLGFQQRGMVRISSANRPIDPRRRLQVLFRV